MDTDSTNQSFITIDDDLWEELLEVTNGAAGPCYQCGVCTATCPWGIVRDEDFTVRTLLRHAQIGSLDGLESLWLCTACAQCEASCPREVPISEVIRGVRYLFWKRRDVLKDLPTTLWSLYWNNNPWGQPPSQRTKWIGEREIPLFDASEHEILLYIGCTPSFDRRAQNITRSLVKVLQAANDSFGILGENEPCCGEAALSLGHRPYFEELANKAVTVFEEHQVEKIIAISPHCYDVMRNEYPEEVDLDVIHYTQYLRELIQAEELTFPFPLQRKVTLQDPCTLGRRNNEYDAPREVIQSIPGISFIEMELSGPEALCCGGGGGRMWMETPIGERFSDLRVQEAANTSADVLATACPFCITCFEDSIKAEGIPGLQVLDIAELAAISIEEDK